MGTDCGRLEARAGPAWSKRGPAPRRRAGVGRRAPRAVWRAPVRAEIDQREHPPLAINGHVLLDHRLDRGAGATRRLGTCRHSRREPRLRKRTRNSSAVNGSSRSPCSRAHHHAASSAINLPSRFRRESRARCVRLFTLAMLRPSTSATSRVERPSTSRSTMTAR